MTDQLFDLNGRVAVVTGGASGLAQAIAIGFARFGADVAVADINDAGMASTCEQIATLKHKAIAVHCDISKPEDVTALFAKVDETFGRVDILLNAPFWFNRTTPEELPLDDWNKALAICLTGYWLCCQAAGRHMIQAGNGGSIINISSIAGSLALGRGNLPYSVAKGGINQMTRELATEWAKYNIRVNAIQPAQTRSPAVKRWLEDPNMDPTFLAHLLKGIPMNRLGEPEDMVGPAVFLASAASAFVTGVLLPVDGGNLAMNAGGSHS
jgi:NAD(P)-dependent dehydrogenase (short-subunit alcohol dehydrogenase family)